LQPKSDSGEKPQAFVPDQPAKKDDSPTKKDPEKNGKKDPPVAAVPLSPFERVLKFPVIGPGGKEFAFNEIPFKGLLEDGTIQEGGMVRAFLDKDAADFAKAWKAKDIANIDSLKPERFGELNALLAWTRLSDAERRKSYGADTFELPATLAGKPLTSDYLAAGKVKIKTLIGDRCTRCHQQGSDGEKFPMAVTVRLFGNIISIQSYDELAKLLVTPK
jgi:hypothetical protein